MIIPSMLLKKLYTLGSLKNAEAGVQFAIKNRLSDAELVGLRAIHVNGTPVALDRVSLILSDGQTVSPYQVSAGNPLAFPLRAVVTIQTPLSA
ncbi:MAG: hydroxymethylglutaryl-CoA reductase, partial [Chloroflexi bacterium]|nr:hydroxymethylglutaryl-CoA reductase [Chloroflexota bacterium]